MAVPVRPSVELESVSQQRCLSQIIGRSKLPQDKVGDVCPRNFSCLNSCHIGQHLILTSRRSICKKTRPHYDPINVTRPNQCFLAVFVFKGTEGKGTGKRGRSFRAFLTGK